LIFSAPLLPGEARSAAAGVSQPFFVEPVYMCFANPLFSQELKDYIIEDFGLIHEGYMSRILNAV
jgi:hypothetical protein